MPIALQDRIPPSVESVPSINHYGSGAKIKRSSGRQHSWPSSFGGYIGQMLATKDTPSGLHPVDSSAFMLKFGGNAKSCSRRKYANETEAEDDLHPMQSVFLGSDRRYNRYWLFLGPCNALDPGHKRIYFESSDDGHWEKIDTEEVIFAYSLRPSLFVWTKTSDWPVYPRGPHPMFGLNFCD